MRSCARFPRAVPSCQARSASRAPRPASTMSRLGGPYRNGAPTGRSQPSLASFGRLRPDPIQQYSIDQNVSTSWPSRTARLNRRVLR